MISINGVSFTYPGATTPALRNLVLEIPQGAFVALVGNNGSGKTSLCKLLTGLIPHFFEGEFSGSVEINGYKTLEHRVSELSQQVGYVYQDFENQLLKPRVLDDVAFAPLNFGMKDYKERAAATLHQINMAHLSDRIIWELSGGEQHLIALAGALVLEPEVIVVDEPVAQLDPVNADIIYQQLVRLNKEHGKTIIVIEHHPDFIGTFCDSVILLKDGSVTWHLPVREALSRIEELEQNDIFSPQVTRIAHGISHLSAEDDTHYPINLAESIPYFEQRFNGIPRTGWKKNEQVRVPQNSLVEFRNVNHSYAMMDSSQKSVLQNINLTFFEGERIALVGANGAGKSTLMRLISGLEKPKEGNVLVLGENTRKKSPEDLADHVSLVYQHPQEMFIEDNIHDDAAYYLKARNISDWKEIVDQAIEDFNLLTIQERDGRLLSGGQQRRASLAIGATMRPAIMLLDEPTSSLDVANRRQIMAMLEKLESWVKTVMIATHDMELVAEWANRVIILHQGAILADNTPETIFGQPGLIEKARIRPPQVVLLSNELGIEPVHLSVESFVNHLIIRDEYHVR